MLQVSGSGHLDSRVWVVGEAPGLEEEVYGKPFIGASGEELNKMLREASIERDACYITNVCQWRPPENKMEKWLTDKKAVGKKAGYIESNGRWAHPLVEEGRQELLQQLERYRPEIVIGFGNAPLWALTGQWGVTNWRGSEMILNDVNELAPPVHFVPTLHPASILRNWSFRPLVVHDLRFRVARRLREGFVTPSWQFYTQPSLDEVLAYLADLRGDIAPDTETMGGHTVCLGVAKSPTEAMCIPFIGPDGVYWTQDEYERVKRALKEVFERPGIRLIGQNWNYDRQYLQHDLQFDVPAAFDTYVAQSVLYPGADRGLGYLSSMYCDWHLYWKEDGKEWSKGIKDFEKEFRYNCRDVCATWEVGQEELKLLERDKLMPQFLERIYYANGAVYNMMQRGVNRDDARTAAIDSECTEAIQARELAVVEAVGHPVNFDSPKQVAKLFYEELGCKSQKKRGTTSVTTDDEALKKVMEENPHVAPIALAILESRSLSKLQSTFLRAELDPDGKFRSSWMATGTETFRLTSSKNAFHRGGNLQNVTDGKHTHSGRKLPNLRSTITPDPGYIIFNVDLERADLQVVAWEADDEALKRVLKEHADIHLLNAIDLFNIKGIPYDECFPTHPNYVEHVAKWEQKRHFGKTFAHLSNYGGKERTCAIKTHTTVHQASLLQRRWFEIHPGIKRWHQRTAANLYANRTVQNKFGYRRIYFDRVDSVLGEALAWVPQSTVGILISLIQMAFEDELDDLLEITMQGHDSLIGQYREENEAIVLPKMYELSKILVPYADPLWIPLELSTSTSSWGEVEKRSWPQTG